MAFGIIVNRLAILSHNDLSSDSAIYMRRALLEPEYFSPRIPQYAGDRHSFVEDKATWKSGYISRDRTAKSLAGGSVSFFTSVRPPLGQP